MNENSNPPITADDVATLLVESTQGMGEEKNHALDVILTFIETHVGIDSEEVGGKLRALFRSPKNIEDIGNPPMDQRMHIASILAGMGQEKKADQLYDRIHKQNLALALASPSEGAQEIIDEVLREIEEDEKTTSERLEFYKKSIRQNSQTQTGEEQAQS